MDFDLFRSILSELRRPEIIRLNYSGESIHHPRLLEALQLASKTGAATELVSAFASFPARDIERFVDTGLDRLTISLHTMDPKQFSEIYRFGSLEELKERIEELLTARHRLGSTRPRLDFAFVAMQRNLVQLGPVADYAQSLGIRDVHIHPVIRRHDIPFTFEEELAEGRLRPRFKQTLQQTVDAVRTRHPQLRFNFSTPEVGDDPIIDEHPRHHAGPVREGVRILTCDQNPWETVHILSNGDVVSCEVRDRIVFGNLRQQTLAEVWSSEPYRLFRRRYVKGEDSLCRACSYKVCYKPGPLESVVSAASQRSAQLRRGWHEGDDGNIVWSQRESVAVLGMPAGTRTIGLQGVLPPSPQGGTNHLSIRCNGELLGTVVNGSTEFLSFDQRFPVQPSSGSALSFQFETAHGYRPIDVGASDDQRTLGFALSSLEAL